MRLAKVGMGVLALALAVGTVVILTERVQAEKGNAACAAGAAAGAQGPLAKFFREGFGDLIDLHKELNVTDDQKQAIRGIVREHKDELLPVIKDVAAKRQALRSAVIAADANEAAIREAADALGKSIGDAAVIASVVAGDVKEVLTPEQINKIKEHRAARRQAFNQAVDEAAKQ